MLMNEATLMEDATIFRVAAHARPPGERAAGIVNSDSPVFCHVNPVLAPNCVVRSALWPQASVPHTERHGSLRDLPGAPERSAHDARRRTY
jgi:hypothetical protein